MSVHLFRRLLPVIFAVLVAVLASGAEELTSLPSEIILKGKSSIKVKEVVRWEKDRVVIRHAGGIDPIRFDSMAPESRRLWEARSKLALPEQEKLNVLIQAKAAAMAKVQQAETEQAELARRAEIEEQSKIEDAIRRRVVMVGMSPAQVIQSWGQPDKVNRSGGEYGTHEQWIYRASNWYLYFRNGKLSSWQHN